MPWKYEILCKLWDVVWVTTVGMMHAVHYRMGGGDWLIWISCSVHNELVQEYTL